MPLKHLRNAERETILMIAHRHDARPDSDIDLLIKTGSDTTPFFPCGLIADLEDALGRKVDVVEEQGLHRLLRDKIQSEAVAL